jgi:hypothetical protein
LNDYTELDIMNRIYLDRGARDDRERLWNEDEDAAATIDALLQEANQDPQILTLFTAHDYGKDHSARFHVSRWYAQQNKGRNLWRLKVWDLECAGLQYRVVYALDPLDQDYYVLGIVDRSFDYDEDHPITKRILAAYDRLGIPTFSGTR